MTARAQTIGVVALMAIGSLALWIAVPAAWLWATRDFESGGARFLVALPGCVLTLVAVGWLLCRLEAVYARLSGQPAEEPGPPSWLRMSKNAGVRRRVSLLDALLMASALAALISLVIWWALLADSPNPSGPLQPL